MKPLKIDEKDVRKILRSETKLSRFDTIARRTFKQIIWLGAIFLLAFGALNSLAIWQHAKYALAKRAPVVTLPAPAPEPTAPLPNYSPEIQISKIGVDAPVHLNIAPPDIIESLKTGVVHYQGTALPGEVGNSVIVGHSSDYLWSNGHYKTIFTLLDKLEVGDTIVIPYGSQQFTYQVTSTFIVKPTDVSVLRRTDTPTLTLITCYPVGSIRSRFIVTASLISGTPTGTQQSDPLNGASLPQPR